MITTDPWASRLQQVLLRMHLETALCHWSAGCQEDGAAAFRAGLERLDTLIRSPHLEGVERVYLVEQVLDLASKLRETRQFEQALAVTRAAAQRTAELAENPTRDRETTAALATKMHSVATLLTQLGQAPEAIPVFKRGLKLFQRLSDYLPENINYSQGVSDAHMGLGKAWARVNRDEDSMNSLARRQSCKRGLSHAIPMCYRSASVSSRCYDRLHMYAVRFEKRGSGTRLAQAPRSGQEIERSWIVSPIAFRNWRNVDRVRRDLTREERAENKQYLEASDQFAQKAAQLGGKSPKQVQMVKVARP